MNSLKVGLLTLSDPARKDYLHPFISRLEDLDIYVDVSEDIYKPIPARRRAEIFNDMIRSQKYDYIFDVSGGDLANLTLPYLDYEAYATSKTWFCGYSDVTGVLNALYQMTGKPCILFQPVFHTPFDEIVSWLHGENVRSLFTWQCDPLIEGQLDGIVVGGNVRCLLKTVGTEYFPSMSSKVLFMESFTGSLSRIKAYFAQLAQMGVFDQIQGVMLGQFTQLDDAFGFSGSSELLKDILIEILDGKELAVWRTPSIGHSQDSKALWVGKNLIIKV